MLGFDGEYQAVQRKVKCWHFSVKKRKKWTLKPFHRKTFSAEFRHFLSNILSNIVWENKILFVTQSRPLYFTFSEVFNICKVSFAVQTDI